MRPLDRLTTFDMQRLLNYLSQLSTSNPSDFKRFDNNDCKLENANSVLEINVNEPSLPSTSTDMYPKTQHREAGTRSNQSI